MHKIWIFAFLFVILFSVNHAYAQHHGGQAAPPVSFGDRKVTISTWLDPVDFNPAKDSEAKLNVRFYDSDTNVNIEKVTYRVQIFSGQTLLATQMFYDSDGELTVKVQPSSQCSEKDVWRCTKYEGEKDPVVPSALTSSSMSTPIIEGPVFDKPGQYTVKVAIIGATNPKTQTTQDIEFENTISIASEQKFSLDTAAGKTPIIVKSFQDQITNFQFSESTKTISFDMPFHWEHAEHVQLVRNSLEIPKSFTPFQNINAFKGAVNGIPIFSKDLYLDPYSNKDTNELHFLVTGEELKTLAKKIGPDSHTMSIVITPDTDITIKSTDVKFPNGYKATISYDPRYGASKDVSFTTAFFDSSGSLAKDIRYAYSIKDSKGNEFIVNTGSGSLLGIRVPSGVDSRLITIPSQGSYTLQMYLVGSGLIDFDSYVPASMKFDISETKSETTTKQIDTKQDSTTNTKKSDTTTETKKTTKTNAKKPNTKTDTKKTDTKKTDTKKTDTKKTDTKKKVTPIKTTKKVTTKTTKKPLTK